MTRRSFYTQTLLHTNAFTHRRFYTLKLLHTKAFTHKPFYTQALLHTGHFTHRPLYTQTILHTPFYTDTCTHRRFYTQTLLHRRFYTQTLLYTDPFTHRRFYTQTLWHTDPFTHRRFYTQMLLHTGAFTHRPFYTQALLHTDPFTHRPFFTQTLLHTNAFTHTQTLLHTNLFTHNCFYTQKLLHTDAFTHRPFYTQTLLYTNAFTHRRFTHRCLHTQLKPQFYLSFWHSNLVLCVKGSSGTLEIAILPQFLTLEPRFVREGFIRHTCAVFDTRTSFCAWRVHPAHLKSQFYLSFWHSNLVLCVKGSSGTLEIAILPQFLTLEPRFVREGFIRTTWNRNFTSVFDTRTSFRAKGLTFPLGTLANRNFTSVFDTRTSFCAWRVHPARLKSQFYLSFWHSNLVSWVKGSSGQLEIAILPQFLTLEPRFVREGFIRTTWNRNFTSVFDTRTSFRARGLTFRDPSSALPAA